MDGARDELLANGAKLLNESDITLKESSAGIDRGSLEHIPRWISWLTADRIT